MTMVVHKLLRLCGDEDWATWGDDWYDHADVISDLNFVAGWYSPPDWLRERSSRRLDWGAVMYEASLTEVRRLIGPRQNYAAIHEDWDRPFRESEERQRALLATLPEEGRYAVVWMEMY